MRRRRTARVPPAAGSAGGDIDALQTDVMRFLSIIGLCLMAMFALVQVIPVTEPGKPSPAAQAARLREDIRAQQQRLRALQTALQALRTAGQSARDDLAAARQDLARVSGQARETRHARDRMQAELDRLDRQLESARRTLAELDTQSREKSQDLEALRGRLQETREHLERGRRTIASLERQAVQRRQTMPEVRPRPTPPETPAPRRQGFSLRFASATALDRLVSAGTVRLYGMAGQAAWRLTLAAGEPVARKTAYPRWYHEMSAATVPAHYLRGLAAADEGPGASRVVWGVQLPADMRAAITARTRGREGGELVIRTDGQVHLEE
jgi:septal ring factor EnvC (AmiA/AmiB activator)